MNSFELRQQKRILARKSQAEKNDFAKILEAVGVQSFFEDAFVQLYGKDPKLSYTGGWFYLQGKRVSRKKLQRLALELYAKIQEQEIEYE
jgi:hypothetical protein